MQDHIAQIESLLRFFEQQHDAQWMLDSHPHDIKSWRCILELSGLEECPEIALLNLVQGTYIPVKSAPYPYMHVYKDDPRVLVMFFSESEVYVISGYTTTKTNAEELCKMDIIPSTEYQIYPIRLPFDIDTMLNIITLRSQQFLSYLREFINEKGSPIRDRIHRELGIGANSDAELNYRDIEYTIKSRVKSLYWEVNRGKW